MVGELEVIGFAIEPEEIGFADHSRQDTAPRSTTARGAARHTWHMSTAALPRVSGRHHNHALAAARRTRAVELRCEGWTYDAIAEELGYAHRATVYAIIRKALASQEAGQTENLRELETERLDRLQAGLWSRAMSGDVASVTQVRRIIEARVRLLGLVDKAAVEQRGCTTVVCSCAPGTGHRLEASGGS